MKPQMCRAPARQTTPSMNNPEIPLSDHTDRRQQLTTDIHHHASGARNAPLHPLRVGHAIACGQALCELKRLLKRGGFIAYVQGQCGLNRMTANRYMRLAGKTDKLTRYMGIREAYLAAGVIREAGKQVK
jgi:hypothetical protein